MAVNIDHSLAVRWRAFRIWQELGYLPWHKPKEAPKEMPKDKADKKTFYKGAFDSIPFLNDDAKRTFVELLFRPGYMIRDYIRGQHDRYMAPLAALIIFYSFFALLSAVLKPYQKGDPSGEMLDKRIENVEVSSDRESAKNIITKTFRLVRLGYDYLSLDLHPEKVDTRHEQAIAALESSLRSQGIPLFIGKLILLWLALARVLKRDGYGSSACATISAFILCQFSFFMLFALIATWGESTSLSALLMLALVSLDLHQMLGVDWKKSVRKAIAVSIWYAVYYVAFLLLISVAIVITAYLTNPTL